jgi:hypothetical protein
MFQALLVLTPLGCSISGGHRPSTPYRIVGSRKQKNGPYTAY